MAMSWSIEFSPVLPMPLIWVALALAGLFLILLLMKLTRGALIRCFALLLLTAALTNPHLKQEDRDPLSNIALVIVDESASQKIAGRAERTETVRRQLAEMLAKTPNLEVRWLTSSHSTNEAREGTTLFADLNRGLSGIPTNRLAGVFLLTDGQIHDAPASAANIGITAPIHALITGAKGERDRRIEILKAPRFGLVGGNDVIKLRIVETGARSSTPEVATLKISREGKPAVTLQVRVGEPIEIPMDFPHAGTNIVELELEAARDELTLANNRTAISAEGIRENLRVLLVSGEPHAGERTWRNLLKSDAAVDLVHFTILRPPEKQDGTPINQLSLIAFPTRELFSEKLEDFDLIIFDRYQRRGVLPLLYLDNVARYVENGGAVLIAAGHEYSGPMSLYRTPLAQVLPAAPSGRVIEQPYKAKITNAGAKHPVTRGLPGSLSKVPDWGRWFRLVEAQPSRGKVLMNGANEMPLLVLDRRNKGRVALLLSDHAWLWARGFEGGGPYTALLRRLAHWLMKEPDLEEEYLRATGSGKQLSVERRSMNDDIEPVAIVAPNGEKLSVTLDKSTPGVWRKRLDVDQPGLYRLRSGDLSTIAHVGPMNSRELEKVAATEDIIKPITEATAGGAFWIGSGKTAREISLPRLSMLRSAKIMHGSNWMGLRKRDAYVVRGVKLLPLFAGFLALIALVGFIALTWFREGR